MLQKGGVPAAPSGTATLLRLSPSHRLYPRPLLAVADFRSFQLPWTVTPQNIVYKCGWSPFENIHFSSKITHTFINGKLVYHNGQYAHTENTPAMALTFNR